MHKICTRLMLPLLLLCAAGLHAQLAPVKRINAPRQAAAAPPAAQQARVDSAPAKLVISRAAASAISSSMADFFSVLRFADLLVTDPDRKGPGCTYWEYNTHINNSINVNTKSPVKNWQKTVAWKKIPAGAVSGRWEISTLPFPPDGSAGFSGVIRSGIIETSGADSVNFTISYTEDTYKPVALQPGAATANPGQITAITKPVQVQPQTAPVTRGQRPARGGTPLSPVLKANFLQDISSERRFYIRIVPLDGRGSAMEKVSNEITVQEKFYEWKAPPPQEYLHNDYTITAVKYVPVHFAESNYACCAIVTGYNGSSNDQFVQSFMAAYPIGTAICPQPPKDKAWYEKAFDGVTGFIKKSIDGAANFYNESKAYLKKKFKEFNCDASGGMAIVNPVTKLQEAAGPEVCEFVSGAAFDYGMAAVGIPPSLPTTDDLTKMAEGQIVELACDKIESETGVPVPDAVREKIRQGFHDNITAQSNSGTVNAGFLRVKPHPLGQFQPAYLQIEVTRTGNAAKNKKGPLSFSISDVTTRAAEDWSASANKKVPVNLKGNLFVPAYTSVPYLENVGDKTTVFVVLKPQESYVHRNQQTGVISNVYNSPQLGVFYTPPTPTYEGIAFSPGFQMLCNKSTTSLSLGLKVAEGVNLIFQNK